MCYPSLRPYAICFCCLIRCKKRIQSLFLAAGHLYTHLDTLDCVLPFIFFLCVTCYLWSCAFGLESINS